MVSFAKIFPKEAFKGTIFFDFQKGQMATLQEELEKNEVGARDFFWNFL